ncbi:hypothetical protein Tco_1091683 [Tanacetum coccineum]|uniref:Uncharacterized protein n=1 Tax=Tanacetum coccineum TaxID=301880 RepID=A0ABQ5I931_9ASTR
MLIIFSNPLFDLDAEIASTKEIDLFLADDGSIPPGIESDDVDSVDDDTSISLPEFESFYVDYPNSGNSTIDVVEDIPDCPDCEDSQFCHSSRVSHLQLQLGIRYPNLID